MSGLAETYVSENIHEKFYDKISKLLKRDDWKLDNTPYYGSKPITRIMDIDVLDENGKKIAMVKVSNKAVIGGDYDEDEQLEYEPHQLLEVITNIK